jgi:hypothetical protein
MCQLERNSEKMGNEIILEQEKRRKVHIWGHDMLKYAPKPSKT